MKEKKLGINATLNLIKTSLSIIFPLITYPYALRVVGVENIGSVSYVTSVVNYFSLFAMLGVSSYAIREGAKVRDNKNEFTTFSCEVFTINLLSTTIAYIALILTVIFVPQFRHYWELFAILGLSVIFSTIGIDWINTVYEDYLFITIRGIVIHVVSLALLFLIVKKPEDYLLYAALQIFSVGFVAVSNWFHCKKYAKLKIVSKPNIKKHLPRLLVLFANSLAISVYVNFDTTMLGWIIGDYDVGIYSVAVRIYTTAKSVMMAIYVVTIPRLATFFGNNDMSGFQTLYTKLWSYMTLLLVPAGVGLACVSKEIIWVFGGTDYLDGTIALQILSLSLIFSIYGGLVTTCLNITIGREKENLIATILSAILNCGLNFIFIPLFTYNGAALTTLFAEIFVLVFCIVRIPNRGQYIEKEMIRRNGVQTLIATVPIIILSVAIHAWISDMIYSLFIIVFSSILIYGLVLIILKNELIISVLTRIKRKKT